MHKKWIYNYTDKKQIKYIVDKYKLNELVAKVLINRNIGEEDLEVFLNPTRDNFYDPYLLPDIKNAIDRILLAREKKEKVIIFGDYDVDGITSLSVLKKFLNDIGMEVDTYMPNRLEEGYGLNNEALTSFKKQGYSLIITVDCGISAASEAKLVKELGMDLIITDHHEPQEILPDAVAVIDPKRKDSMYPFRNLAGVGVAFKITQALSKKLELEDKEYLKYLDLVCLGTIADIVPLVDENRVIASLGLKLVAVTKNPGIRALLDISNYKKIDSTAISFGIAPRINACGRMGYEQEALKLFLTQSYDEALVLAKKLNKYNSQRQEIEKRIYNEAIKEIEEKELYKKNAIVIGKDNWHHGVIGIVASKICDLYYKPTILICFDGNTGKGSGRSIQGFDLHGALSKLTNYLDKFGGHEMAIGMTIDRKNFDEFKNAFEDITTNISDDDLVPVAYVDEVVTHKDISIQAVKDLDVLKPYGEANSLPLFVYKNIKIDSLRTLSDEKHLKLTLKDGNKLFDAIGFNMGNMAKEFQIGDKVDVLMQLEINSYNNSNKVQFNLKDIRKVTK